jgi:hypothetical protein
LGLFTIYLLKGIVISFLKTGEFLGVELGGWRSDIGGHSPFGLKVDCHFQINYFHMGMIE